MSLRESPEARARRLDKSAEMTEVRPVVLRRDNYTCQAGPYLPGRCEGRLVVHHRKIRGQGGPTTPANLVTLCGGVTGRDAHHGYVHDHPTDSYANGLLIRAADPDPVDRWRPPADQDSLDPLPDLDWWGEEIDAGPRVV